MPQIAVIIPTYNGSAWIAETIRSVLEQTVSELELIVVDDGSYDDTPALIESIAEKDNRVRFIRQPNRGVACARNRGLAEVGSSAESVMFLDHDDILEPRALERLSRLLDARPDVSAAHGTAGVIDALGEIVGDPPSVQPTLQRRQVGLRSRAVPLPSARPCGDGEDTTYAVLLYGNCIVTPGQALLRRALLPDQPFDPQVEPADDWDLYLRLAREAPLAYLPEVVVRWRLHETNRTKTSDAVRRAHERLHRKWLMQSRTPRERRAIVGQFAYTALATTLDALKSADAHKLRREALPALGTLIYALGRWLAPIR